MGIIFLFLLRHSETIMHLQNTAVMWYVWQLEDRSFILENVRL